MRLAVSKLSKTFVSAASICSVELVSSIEIGVFCFVFFFQNFPMCKQGSRCRVIRKALISHCSDTIRENKNENNLIGMVSSNWTVQKQLQENNCLIV